jgi:D-beta-D-heptose 7-phosphate kinase/D-beta-D-heptose 1-phosphate adenosyltransferase
LTAKLGSLAETVAWRQRQRDAGRTVVLTNGCFDLLHRGHVDLLREARAQGDALVVAVNDDASMRRLKGPSRPLVPEEDRAELLAALEMVDRVVFFGEDTPAEIIAALLPDVLVKGADYELDQIVGRHTVEEAGGRVHRVRLTAGRSTRDLVRLVLERYQGADGAPTGKENR